MRHVFRVTKIGWDKEQEGIWFDSDQYTEDIVNVCMIWSI